jgi:hypothetical protein
MKTHTTPARLAAAALTLALAGAFSGDALAQRKRSPPPPPPPPSDTNLQLVSTGAAGQAIDGAVCGISADGGKVLFATRNGSFEPQQLFVKDFNGSSSSRVVSPSTPSVQVTCLAMTPDAATVVFVDGAPNGIRDALGREGVEAAIKTKNLLTGVETRVTPMLGSLPGASKFRFAGVSDDGRFVAFIAEPTFSCVLYSCTATGPTRMFLRDVGTGGLINLDSLVRLTSSQGRVDGDALLSPDGKTLAFATRAPYPELGDGNASGSDVFVLDLASSTVRMASTDAHGRQITIAGFAASASGPTYGVQSFLSGSKRIAFRSAADLNVGSASVYAKDLVTGALDRMLPEGFSVDFPNVNVNGFRADLSFSDDGRKVAYVQRTNTNPGMHVPAVIDLTTGVRFNPASLSNGTTGNGPISGGMLMSRDGRAAAFDNNSTNLVAGTSTNVLRTYRRLLP